MSDQRTIEASCTRCGAKFAMTDSVDIVLAAYFEWDERHNGVCAS